MVRTPYVAAVEHDLRPAEQGATPEVQTEPDFEVIEPGKGPISKAPPTAALREDESVRDEIPEPVWAWPIQHLEASRNFPDPFLGGEVYPEVSIGTTTLAAHVDKSKAIEFASTVDLSFYWLKVRFPVISTLDGSRPEPAVDFNLKVPFAIPGSDSNWLGVSWGATLSDSRPILADSSRFELLYAYGGGVLAAQLRVGYGYRELLPGLGLRQGLLYGAQLGLTLGKVQPMVEVDGMRFVGGDDQISILPGVRFLPATLPTLQIGVAGLAVLGGNDRFGGLVELSYNFL
ncbi:MAG: hypothetical protein ACOX6T_02635 [Myxococcales bacterium]|jgi:hypothetical protein